MKERSMKEGKEIKSLFDKEFDFVIRLIRFAEDSDESNDSMIIEIFRSDNPNILDYPNDPDFQIIKSESGSGNIDHMIDILKEFPLDHQFKFHLDFRLNLSMEIIWKFQSEIYERFDKSFPDLFGEISIDES